MSRLRTALPGPKKPGPGTGGSANCTGYCLVSALSDWWDPQPQQMPCIEDYGIHGHLTCDCSQYMGAGGYEILEDYCSTTLTPGSMGN